MNDSADALATLREWQRSGRLVERYDRIGGLLDRMTGGDRARARPVLARIDPAAVRDRHTDLAPVSVAVTGNGTLTTFASALVVALIRHGYVPEVRLGDFGGYVFELGDGSAERADVTVCVLDHAAVFDEVAVPFTVEDIRAAFAAKLTLWRGLVDRFRAAGPGLLVLNTVPLPKHVADEVIDYPSRARLAAAWRSANAELLGLAGPSVVVLDLDPLLGNGIELVEPRFDVYAHVHLSDALQVAYAGEVGHLVRAATGRAKKLLAVDLDQTLWGGVLGDDGADGVVVTGPGRGAAFQRFQLVLRQLQSQGVLLAAVSKNDRSAVLDALRTVRGMAVREEHFAAVAASWDPKPGSLRHIVESMNIGMDSVVFADDSPHERALVAHELPDVVPLALDDEPAHHVRTLLADGWFTVMQLTGEDRERTALYRQEAARSEFLSAASPEEFLAGLGVEVAVGPVPAADMPRLSQLTLRTNQFNLTTRRLQQADVQAIADDPARRVLGVRTRDRFGDNGIVGAILLRAEPDSLYIDNFVLSCRVFGRGIEAACLSSVLAAARQAGYRAVHGAYRATAKNGKVRDLYPLHGFAPEAGTDGQRSYVHVLREVPPPPGHLAIDCAADIVPNPALTT